MTAKISDLRRVLSEDKRKSERLQLPVKVAYSLIPAKKWLKPVSLEDIGADGLKFTCAEKITPGAELNLKITLTDAPENQILVTAGVLRCGKIKPLLYQAAVKFHKMNYGDRQRFVEYLCENILLTCLKK